MPTTTNDIRMWLKEAKESNCTHLMVVCDTYDWEDYPINIYPKGESPYPTAHDDLEKAIKQFDGLNMQKIMEIYDLSKDVEKQLNQYRVGLELVEKVRSQSNH